MKTKIIKKVYEKALSEKHNKLLSEEVYKECKTKKEAEETIFDIYRFGIEGQEGGRSMSYGCGSATIGNISYYIEDDN